MNSYLSFLLPLKLSMYFIVTAHLNLDRPFSSAQVPLVAGGCCIKYK